MDLEAYLAAKKVQDDPVPSKPAPTAPVTIDKPKKPISTRKFGGSSDDSSDEDFAPSKKPTSALANKPLPKIGGSKPKPSVAFKDDDDDDGGDDWKPKAAPA